MHYGVIFRQRAQHFFDQHVCRAIRAESDLAHDRDQDGFPEAIRQTPSGTASRTIVRWAVSYAGAQQLVFNHKLDFICKPYPFTRSISG